VPGEADAHAALWREIHTCRKCLADPALSPILKTEPVFVPLPGPPARPDGFPVRYMLVAAEPSAAWALSAEDGRDKITRGFRNFMHSSGDFVLQYAAERWLVGAREAYVITDLAKCAMSIKAARAAGQRCYENCSAFLEREVALFQPKAMIGVGQKAFGFLRGRPMAGVQIFGIVHYSVLGQVHWNQQLGGPNWREDLPPLETLQAFFDARRRESLALKDRLTATEIDLKLLAVYRQQFSAIREALATGETTS